MTGGVVSDGGERRRHRLAQLAAMSDEELAFELLEHQTARWGARGLVDHYARHANDVGLLLGRMLGESEFLAIAEEVRLRPDRVFTRLTEDTEVEYGFVGFVHGRRAILLVVTRRGLVRTLFPTPLQRWLKRHAEAVEVTERVRRVQARD